MSAASVAPPRRPAGSAPDGAAGEDLSFLPPATLLFSSGLVGPRPVSA